MWSICSLRTRSCLHWICVAALFVRDDRIMQWLSAQRIFKKSIRATQVLLLHMQSVMGFKNSLMMCMWCIYYLSFIPCQEDFFLPPLMSNVKYNNLKQRIKNVMPRLFTFLQGIAIAVFKPLKKSFFFSSMSTKMLLVDRIGHMLVCCCFFLPISVRKRFCFV